MKVYLSLTSIVGNIKALEQTIQSIEQQTVKPDECFLYLSKEPYLFDTGFRDGVIPPKINSDIFEIKWVKNTGPYRKLLPLLQDKIDEDCVIITIDDDTGYSPTMIEDYVEAYQKYDCVIAHRSFGMYIADIKKVDYTHRTKHLSNPHIYYFHTGKGGVLYHPKFFQRSIEHLFSQEIYQECCPTGDDIWFNFHRIANGVGCYVPQHTSFVKDYNTKNALWTNVNSKNNNNSMHMQKTVRKLLSLGYAL